MSSSVQDENTEMMVEAVLAERDAPYNGYFLTNKVLRALRQRIHELVSEARDNAYHGSRRDKHVPGCHFGPPLNGRICICGDSND